MENSSTDVLTHKLKVRNLQLSDYNEVGSIMEESYVNMGGAWKQAEYAMLLSLFPRGQICIEDRGTVVAVALTLKIDYSDLEHDHSYKDIVSNGSFESHDNDGDYLYGIDLFVRKDYQGMRLGRRLYDARKELCEDLNLKGIIVGGRIPGYAQYHKEMSPGEYVQKVKTREIIDKVLTFQLSNDFHPKRAIRNYNPEDKASQSHAVFLVWDNIFYETKKKQVWGRKSNVRLGIAQWQMRPFQSPEELLQQVEFFVDTVSGYHADLILFPELFNAPLLSRYNQDDPPQAMRHLAEYTELLRNEMLKMAMSYNINIVAGSLPKSVDQRLYNVSFLCRRDGTWDSQYKLHITPDETEYWGLRGGRELKIFDTDIGQIGILICYDVEFPELSRLLADKGMKILLVPFWADTQNSYLRIRRCAQARAIENECYVAIAGSVGNLPKVENMDIQYSVYFRQA